MQPSSFRLVLHLNDTFCRSVYRQGQKRRLEVKDLCDGMRGESEGGRRREEEEGEESRGESDKEEEEFS